MIQFTDSSKNATERNWDFENDGSTDSRVVNPVHVFSSAGNYTINLTAVNENGTDSMPSSVAILEQPALPEANFSVKTTQGPAPLSVQFIDLSENAVFWNLDFDSNGQSELSIGTRFIYLQLLEFIL